MCSVVVIEDGSTSKQYFIQIWKALKIAYWVISRFNHKGNSYKKYHRFFKKVQTIHGNDRVIHDILIKNTKTSQYYCNSTPTKGTYIAQFFAGIRSAFIFPIFIELAIVPELKNESNTDLIEYLCNVSINSKFSPYILQVVTEYCCTAHLKRMNLSK